ncbi:hypothetical protein [Picrophilus oshimae]|nr:hypothetical protein [Picrophilus oshimae]
MINETILREKINVCNNCNINYILGRIGDIINNNFMNPQDILIHDYLIAAHNLFLTWAGRFPSAINNITRNQLQNMLSDFILEANNSSWNNMQRTDMAVAQNPNLRNVLQDLVYNINNGLPNINDVVRRLNNICNPSLRTHVNGMGVFLATAILFANDNRNFMVIDNPVRMCFGLNNNISQIAQYNNIIMESQRLGTKND